MINNEGNIMLALCDFTVLYLFPDKYMGKHACLLFS